MRQFIIRRSCYSIVTLFILSLTIFAVVRLTGDPATLMTEPGARPEDHRDLPRREDEGQPLEDPAVAEGHADVLEGEVTRILGLPCNPHPPLDEPRTTSRRARGSAQ